jgi:protein AATF/BFR2
MHLLLFGWCSLRTPARYEVHEKLQNFMVPVPAHNGWHEEQIDELFGSLLGKGFEDAMEIHPEPAQVEMNVQLGTFRIFG